MSRGLHLITLTYLLLMLSVPAHAQPDFEAFASCISASGAIYYGAHWCPQCRKQTAMFGRGARELPYVECAVRGGRAQLKHCSHIDGYPTWIFANGQKRAGVLSMDRLASHTGCELSERSHFRYPLE